jgi:pilus assembly protein Flp/PilA
MKLLKNYRGQGLIEYLIIVALVSVGAIGIMKVISQNVRVHFTHIAEALGSKASDRPQKGEITKSMHSEKDFNNFWEGTK